MLGKKAYTPYKCTCEFCRVNCKRTRSVKIFPYDVLCTFLTQLFFSFLLRFQRVTERFVLHIYIYVGLEDFFSFFFFLYTWFLIIYMEIEKRRSFNVGTSLLYIHLYIIAHHGYVSSDRF